MITTTMYDFFFTCTNIPLKKLTFLIIGRHILFTAILGQLNKSI